MKVTVGFTAEELVSALVNQMQPSLIVRLVRALQLIDEERAREVCSYYGIAPPPT